MNNWMDATVGDAVGAVLPRPGFAEELLESLRAVALSSLADITPIADASPDRSRWLAVGGWAGAAVGAAGAACYALVRRRQRGTAA